jgi:hypothetical protein
MAEEEPPRCAKRQLDAGDEDNDAPADGESDGSMLFKRPRVKGSDEMSDVSDDTGNADGKIPALLPTRKEFGELQHPNCVVMSTAKKSCYDPMHGRPSIVILELDDDTLAKVASMSSCTNSGSLVDPETFADHLFVLADICEEAASDGELVRASQAMSIASSQGIVCTAYSLLPDDVLVGDLRGLLFLSGAMFVDK